MARPLRQPSSQFDVVKVMEPSVPVMNPLLSDCQETSPVLYTTAERLLAPDAVGEAVVRPGQRAAGPVVELDLGAPGREGPGRGGRGGAGGDGAEPDRSDGGRGHQAGG
ncbi:hypothetical protein GCM10020000_10720 [Streptomyces olivoverticillatus]